VDEPQQRVTFRFAGEMEVQYLTGLPAVGDRVSHDGELWVVTGVESDSVGALVVCASSRHELSARKIDSRPSR
jgi:hypothetical protein